MIRLLLLFSFLPVFAFQTTEFKLSNEEFLKKLQSLPDAQLVDVRTQGEFRKNHLKGAMNL
ncbi:MAG TPA: rhodanese-like domain-containing protein, partial [Flavobacteriales bacterium]|nr:rhodanese-like domain-containing protein [Flavobacteriales bacterium]